MASLMLKVALIAPLAAITLVAGDLLAPHNTIVPQMLGTKAALADDDDDDDRGSSGRSGSYSPGAGWRGGKNLFPFRGLLPRQSSPRRSQASAPAAPTRAPAEIVGFGFSPAELGRLTTSGFEVLERVTPVSFEGEVIKLRIPPGLTLEAARQRAQVLAPQAVIDFNHYFRPEQRADRPCVATDCLARTVIGWPSAQDWPGACAGGVRIGLVDTAINADHDAFKHGNIEIVRLANEELRESGKQHGTAVAALLVGSSTSRTPGLIPGGTLIAVDAFHRAGRLDDRSGAFELVRALDLLIERGVQVINLSLAGPPNLLLERAVRKVGERGIIMVAAAGNDGPKAEPVHPAAYEEVIAVTATGQAQAAVQARRTRRAHRLRRPWCCCLDRSLGQRGAPENGHVLCRAFRDRSGGIDEGVEPGTRTRPCPRDADRDRGRSR